MPKNQKPDLSIVIPALNEEKRVGKTLDKLAEFLQNDPTLNNLAVEVVVVSANSTDRTHEVVQSKAHLFKRYVFLKPGSRLGKGRDVAYGMLRAKGDVIVFMDADMSTPLRHISRFYKVCSQGAPIVVGTRNLQKHHHNLLRRAISNSGNLLFRLAGGVWIEDSQCGFKMFTRKASESCFSKMTITGWGFDMEILAIARANKIPIKTLRIEDWRHAPGGVFESGMIGNILDSLVDLMRIARNRLARKYTT